MTEISWASFHVEVANAIATAFGLDDYLKAAGTYGIATRAGLPHTTDPNLIEIYGVEMPYIGIRVTPGPKVAVIGGHAWAHPMKVRIYIVVRLSPPTSSLAFAGNIASRVAKVLWGMNGSTIANGNQFFVEEVSPGDPKATPEDPDVTICDVLALFSVNRFELA